MGSSTFGKGAGVGVRVAVGRADGVDVGANVVGVGDRLGSWVCVGVGVEDGKSVRGSGAEVNVGGTGVRVSPWEPAPGATLTLQPPTRSTNAVIQ